MMFHQSSEHEPKQFGEFLKSVEEESIRHRVLFVEALSLFLNIVCLVIASVLAFSDNSVAALALALDTFLDMFATLVVIWRFRRSKSELSDTKKRNKIALLIMCILFFVSAFTIEIDSVNTLLAEEKPVISFNYIILSISQSVVFSILAIYKFRLAQKLVYASNSILISDGINTLITSLCSLSMAISMSLYCIDNLIWYFDSIFGLVIGIGILWYGCHLLFSLIFFSD